MFDILKRMENLMIFIEVLGYIAIALMVLQIVLTIGMMACKSSSTKNESSRQSNDSFNESSYDSLVYESRV